MGLSNIGPQFNKKPNKKVQKSSSSVLLSVRGKDVLVQHDRIKRVAKGLAKVAYTLGKTNDEEEYAEEVAEDVFEALKLYGKKKKKKKKY